MITIKTLYIIFYVICFNEFYYYSPVAGKHCMSHLLCIIDTYSDFIYRIKTELKLHNLLIKFEIYVYLLHYSLFSYMVALKILAEHRIQKKMECNLRYVNIVKYLYDRMWSISLLTTKPRNILRYLIISLINYVCICYIGIYYKVYKYNTIFRLFHRVDSRNTQ